MPRQDTAADWGFLASVGDRLFGTAQKPGASYGLHDRYISANVSHWDNVPMVTSTRLFALDRHDGREQWTYRHPQRSVIINPTIALGDGRIYFIETRDPKTLDDADGRVPLGTCLASGLSYLTALDQTTGEAAWRRPIDLTHVRHALYLSFGHDTLLVTGTHNENNHPRYDLTAFDPRNGEPRWTNHYIRTDKATGGDHGEQDQHPVILSHAVYSRPAAFDLATGRQLAFNLERGGHGCGTISGSAHYLYGRGANPRMYPTEGNGVRSSALTSVTRPGCWINMIPADGLVLVPESSAGCSCAFAVQTSIAFAPRAHEPLSKE